MAMKCVHKGCGKTFTDPAEPCVYHPAGPEFHEGQKGWRCCKPRVLTFDEFLSIPPCTTGVHSTVDDTPKAEPAPAAELPPSVKPVPAKPQEEFQAAPRVPTSARPSPGGSSTPAPESDSDEETTPVPASAHCKRRGCGFQAPATPSGDRSGEECIYHPGQALFHEGSKGWTCCKRRVLEFDEFMKIPGCKTRARHCFVGKKAARNAANGGFEKVDKVRHDYYQTPSAVHASLYLKKVDKASSRITFTESTVEVDLKTGEKKQYAASIPLYGAIKPADSTFAIKGTKIDLTLAKSDGLGWPVLRADEKLTGEIIQTGRAGRA